MTPRSSPAVSMVETVTVFFPALVDGAADAPRIDVGMGLVGLAKRRRR